MTSNIRKRIVYFQNDLFFVSCLLATTIGLIAVAGLILYVSYDASGWLTWDFLTKAPSRFPRQAGIAPLIAGSFFLMVFVALFSLPVGVATAIHLEEFMKKNFLKTIIEMNISNLAGVPSIVYGLLGLGIFVGFFGFGPGIVLVGALTLSLRILPVVIVSSQEAIRAVPDSLREASYALGATRWQMIQSVVLPESIPGIMTGLILALATAIGETAPLILIGVATTIFSAPDSLFSPFGALPLQIFAWSDNPIREFQHGVNPAAIIVLLLILFSMMWLAVFIRNRYQRFKR